MLYGKYEKDILVIVDTNLSKKEMKGYFTVPNYAIAGSQRSHYKPDFNLKSTDELIKEGLLDIKDTEKVVDNRIVDKTDIELMKEGLKDIPNGLKISEGKLVPKTSKELLEDGDITKEEFDKILSDERKDKIVSNIREIYSIDEECMLINLGIEDKKNTEYVEYRKVVKNIREV